MNRRTPAFLISLVVFLSTPLFAAHVITDAELDKITGQTGIVLNVVLDSLVGENYDQLTEEQKGEVRQMIEKTFGPLTREEIDQIISSQQLFAEMIQQLPEKDRKSIEEAFDIITSELNATAPAELLATTDGGQLSADNISDWAEDKVSKILIAQQIINDMIQSLAPAQYNQMMVVQNIVDRRFDTLKQ
ncbi:MAG: hypothetical protein AB1724_13840 [Thermodesulfobacteriota bacterium]